MADAVFIAPTDLGAGLVIDGADKVNVVLNVTTAEVYEYRDLWAEESGGANANNAEWSYGNGATGNIGIPFPAGWELVEMSYQADAFAAAASITVDCVIMNGGGAGTVLGSITLANAADGGGGTNHAFKVQAITGSTALAGDAVVGFITRGVSGTISDERVAARFRRSIGSFVTGVSV